MGPKSSNLRLSLMAAGPTDDASNDNRNTCVLVVHRDRTTGFDRRSGAAPPRFKAYLQSADGVIYRVWPPRYSVTECVKVARAHADEIGYEVTEVCQL